jgi:hypothetical protein
MTKTTQTTPMKRAPGRVIVVRRDGPAGKRVTTISGSNSTDTAKIAERLLSVLRKQDATSASRIFFVTFSDAPTRAERQALVKRLERELTDEELTDSCGGWGGPRLTVPPRSGPSFALPSLDPGWYCGFCLNPTTLVLGDLDAESPLDGTHSVSVAHWHPGSRTSGSWRDHYAILGNGIEVAWSFKDEDGTYISFHRSRGDSPTAMTKSLDDAVTSWYLYRAEHRFLTAHFLGFSSGNVEWLGTDENTGYEIEGFSLRASDDVLRELKRLNPPMTQEEATLWLDVTKRVVDPSVWEYWTTGDYPEEFLMNLLGVAEGRSGTASVGD